MPCRHAATFAYDALFTWMLDSATDMLFYAAADTQLLLMLLMLRFLLRRHAADAIRLLDADT